MEEGQYNSDPTWELWPEGDSNPQVEPDPVTVYNHFTLRIFFFLVSACISCTKTDN